MSPFNWRGIVDHRNDWTSAYSMYISLPCAELTSAKSTNMFNELSILYLEVLDLSLTYPHIPKLARL